MPAITRAITSREKMIDRQLWPSSAWYAKSCTSNKSVGGSGVEGCVRVWVCAVRGFFFFFLSRPEFYGGIARGGSLRMCFFVCKYARWGLENRMGLKRVGTRGSGSVCV